MSHLTERERLQQQADRALPSLTAHLPEAERRDFYQEHAERCAFERAQRTVLRNHAPKRPLVMWGGGLVVVLCGLVGALYVSSGRGEAVQQGMQAFAQFQTVRQQQQVMQPNEDYIVYLQNRLRENANDGERWIELAQAYALNNEFEQAMISYRNAHFVLGETAAIWGGMATVVYYRQRHHMTPQVKDWIAQALALDPYEAQSLLLLASDAYLRHDFTQAIQYWETLLHREQKGIDRREIIRSIQAAKAQAKSL